MKPATCIAVILPALVIVAPVVGRALSDRGNPASSETRQFTIDGTTFQVKDPGVHGLSLLERELAERGIEALPLSTELLSVLDAQSVETLDDAPAQEAVPMLPRGLLAEHFMKMETGSGPVEIAFGRVVCGGKDILGRLRSSGWECRESGSAGAIAQLLIGKEASVVVLEKNEGRFLAIRRAAR